MKILKLTIKKTWYDKIASGFKKEEYREIKPHWFSRLVKDRKEVLEQYCHDVDLVCDSIKRSEIIRSTITLENYDAVEFKNGYAKSAPTILVECLGIEMGIPRREWFGSFHRDLHFVIKLGAFLSQ